MRQYNFRMPLYWRLLAWFCAVNVLVLVLGGVLAQRYIAYATAVHFDWTTLAVDANRAYERGGRNGLAVWVERQRRQGIEASLVEHGKLLYPIHVPPKLQSQRNRSKDDIVGRARVGG